MRVFLIRHPQPLIEPGVCYGRLDVDADAEHLRASSERLAARLAREVLTGPFAAAHPGGQYDSCCPRIVASPARRCRGLADALAATLGATPHYDARLLEKDFGDWEGRRWDDIDPELIDAWAADVMHFVPPGGESVSELAVRALACAADLGLPASDTLPGIQRATGASSQPAASGDTLVLVTHAGIIRVLLGHWLDLPLAEWSTLKLDFGALTRVDFVGENAALAANTDRGANGTTSSRNAVLHTLNG